MKYRVVELFAGVGGFRVGFNHIKAFDSTGRAIENGPWEFVWANQWEPGSKTQDAFNIYNSRFGNSESHANKDITLVDKKEIPDHDVLVGGFPCQDYSVARSLSGEKGIEGKKGVLWWEIYKTLKAKKPPFILLENVDRLLKSPSKQRGRDFGIMLAGLYELGYDVEWRVINAADYGMTQRRRRVFIFGYHKSTKVFKERKNISPNQIILKDGFFAQAVPITNNQIDLKTTKFENVDLLNVSNTFSLSFENAGYMKNGVVYTGKTFPQTTPFTPLKDIIEKTIVPEKYYINGNIEKWRYLKGSKKIARTSKQGIEYIYSEGPIAFPDPLDKPGRTMLTSEGTLNRSSHLILDPINQRYRILTPLETERLNSFPDNWTASVNDKKRYFLMGNALVCNLVSILADTLFGYFSE